MKDETNNKYFRNTKTANSRTIRLEVVGEVTPLEKEFLDGVALFMAGTLSKNNKEHTIYVSGQMSKLIKNIVDKMRADREKRTE